MTDARTQKRKQVEKAETEIKLSQQNYYTNEQVIK